MKTNKNTVKHRVDLISTFYLVQQKALSWVTWHGTWYSGKGCRVRLDIWPGTAERPVEGDSTLDLVQWKALSIVTRYMTWYSRKRCRLWLDIGHIRLTIHYLISLPTECIYELNVILKINIGYFSKQSNKLCWLTQCTIGHYILVTCSLFTQWTTADIHMT